MRRSIRDRLGRPKFLLKQCRSLTVAGGKLQVAHSLSLAELNLPLATCHLQPIANCKLDELILLNLGGTYANL